MGCCLSKYIYNRSQHKCPWGAASLNCHTLLQSTLSNNFGMGGVEDVPWITFTLLVRFFDKYHAATIPKSLIEFLRFFFNFLTCSIDQIAVIEYYQ